MKKLTILAVAFTGLLILASGCANCPVHRALFGSSHCAPDKAVAAGQASACVDRQPVCPVMGGSTNADIFVDHEGRRVYFCCPACKDVFRKDPAKYLAKLDSAAEPSQSQ